MVEAVQLPLQRDHLLQSLLSITDTSPGNTPHCFIHVTLSLYLISFRMRRLIDSHSNISLRILKEVRKR